MESNNDVYKVVIAKLELMQSYFNELDPLLIPEDENILSNSVNLHAIERLFQLIVDAAIDINTAIIKEKDMQPSLDYQSTFEIMATCKVLPDDLARAIAPSVGLRNALVHVYEKIDSKKVIHDIKRNIGQYRQYIKCILEYLDQA